MNRCFSSAINVCFPFWERRKKNIILKNDIDSHDYVALTKKYFNDVDCIEQIDEKDLNDLYEREFSRKDKFEDKAKTNIAAVTIFVTLIMGSYTLIDNIAKKYPFVIVSLIASFIFLVAVIYMFLAGYNAFYIISEINIVHRRRIGVQEKENIRKEYIENTCYNRAVNLIRNNYISTSYACLKNALVCLLLVMVIGIFPYNIIGGSKDYSVHTSKHVVFYSASCNSVISEENERKYIENLILWKVSSMKSDSGSISFVDDNKRLFIKMRVEKDIVNVYLIEPYTK